MPADAAQIKVKDSQVEPVVAAIENALGIDCTEDDDVAEGVRRLMYRIMQRNRWPAVIRRAR